MARPESSIIVAFDNVLAAVTNASMLSCPELTIQSSSLPLTYWIKNWPLNGVVSTTTMPSWARKPGVFQIRSKYSFMFALSASTTTKSNGVQFTMVSEVCFASNFNESSAGPTMRLTFCQALLLHLISSPNVAKNGSISSDTTWPQSGRASAIANEATPQKDPTSRTRFTLEDWHKRWSFAHRSGLADQDGEASNFVSPSPNNAAQSSLFTALRNSSTGPVTCFSAHLDKSWAI
mmetsp:Transcript_90663/g.143297  ORF Transcript_90663/g.143297 Transcript_90663/m.143297 type:complete len:234 (+) Transcript_90663:305-1006(+)